MPTYEYECAACGHKFDVFQSIQARPVSKCPACGKARAKRLISAGSGIIFRGTGFYETDYRRGASYKEQAKKDAEGGTTASANGAASTSDAKTESKPAPAKSSEPKKDKGEHKGKPKRE